MNDVTAEEVPPVGSFTEDFVGDFVWSAGDASDLLDFERLTLNPDGTYRARVVATLVNPQVRSFGGHTCMLPEEGEWNTYLVSGKVRLRIRPTTSRARVYSAAVHGDSLEIARRGAKTTLMSVPPASCQVPIVAAHREVLSPAVHDELEAKLRSA